jgi:phosphoserine phosphatase
LIKLVVFDLDNVIIDGEAIDEIGKLVNVQNEIAEITKNAMNGDLDFETSIKERVKLLKGVSVEDIKKVANDLKLMKGAEKTIKALKKENYLIAIISGSFDLIANPLKDKLDVDFLFTNTLIEDDGKLTGEVEGPLVKGSKSDVLKEFIGEQNISLEETVAIGDGANDISMLEISGLSIAFNAKPTVKEIADVVVEEKDLNKILEIINTYNSDKEINTEISENVSTLPDDEGVVEVTETVSVNVSILPDDEEAVEVTETVSVNVSTLPDDEGVVEVTETVSVNVSTLPDDEVVSKNVSTLPDEKQSNKNNSNKNKKSDKKDKKKSKKKRKKLPETGFVPADDFVDVLKQKNEHEQQILEIADERDEFNKVSREQRILRNKLNDELKENLKLAIDFKNKRNKANEEVEKYKKLRSKVNGEIKKLDFSSGRKDRLNIEKEIEKIDKTVETNVLDIKKENQLVKKANDLRKQLNEFKEDEKVKAVADKLKTDSEEYHSKVVELSENAQEYHEKMLEYFKKTDKIRKNADKAHELFVKARNGASDKHESFKMVLSNIHIINAKLSSFQGNRRDESRELNAKHNKEEKEKAESIFDGFKHGKKLSTDELLLLQKHNIG